MALPPQQRMPMQSPIARTTNMQYDRQHERTLLRNLLEQEPSVEPSRLPDNPWNSPVSTNSSSTKSANCKNGPTSPKNYIRRREIPEPIRYKYKNKPPRNVDEVVDCAMHLMDLVMDQDRELRKVRRTLDIALEMCTKDDE